MDGGKKILGLVLALASAAATAAPAEAQYYPRDRGNRIADEIAREAARAAEAAGAIAGAVRGAEDAMRGAINSYHYRTPAERRAGEICAIRAERYGRVSIDRVYPYKRYSIRVEGIADPGRGFGRYGYDRRYRPRSFTCTVREDGRVKFKTRRLRY